MKVVLHEALIADLERRLGRSPTDEDLPLAKNVLATRGEGPLLGLQHLPNLRTLAVERWTDLALPSLAVFPHLKSLSLEGCDLSSLEALRGHPQVRNVTLKTCLIQDLQVLCGLPDLVNVLLDGLPLDEHSYRVVPTQLRDRGVTLIAFERNLPEVAFRMMRRLCERGIEVCVIVDDVGKTRLLAPGRDHEVSKLAVLDEAQVQAILDVEPALDTESFMEKARAVFHAELARRRLMSTPRPGSR